MSDTSFPVAVPCAATADTSIGSTCAISTSANAVVPGSVQTGSLAIWQLGQVQVYDGGAKGTAGASDAKLFEVLLVHERSIALLPGRLFEHAGACE